MVRGPLRQLLLDDPLDAQSFLDQSFGPGSRCLGKLLAIMPLPALLLDVLEHLPAELQRRS